jgi:uncharacterized membrane protein YcaP (DUF421 family)
METVIRVAVIYALIVLGLRVLGKREFGQLSPIELVTLLLIPEIVSNALQREDQSVTNGIIGLATLFTLVFATSLLTSRFGVFNRLLDGTPTVLVHRGELIAKNLQRERISPDELASELRKSGLEHVSQVKWAILETDGKISIVPARAENEAGHTG